MKGSTALKGALLLTIVGQLMVLGYRELTATEWIRLELDMVLPYTIAPLEPLNASVVRSVSRSCSVTFVCTTSCPYCSKLATQFSDSAFGAFSVAPSFFIGDDNREVVEAWAVDHSLDRGQVAQVTPTQAGFFDRATYGLVWSTPFRVIYDVETLEVRDARPSSTIPTSEELSRLCEMGGISPRNLDELEEIFADSIPPSQ